MMFGIYSRTRCKQQNLMAWSQRLFLKASGAISDLSSECLAGNAQRSLCCELQASTTLPALQMIRLWTRLFSRNVERPSLGGKTRFKKSCRLGLFVCLCPPAVWYQGRGRVSRQGVQAELLPALSGSGSGTGTELSSMQNNTQTWRVAALWMWRVVCLAWRLPHRLCGLQRDDPGRQTGRAPCSSPSEHKASQCELLAYRHFSVTFKADETVQTVHTQAKTNNIIIRW